MSYSDVVADAELFTALHHAIAEQTETAPSDRRQNERRPYECAQFLAPFDGIRLPPQEDYARVLCHDLSPSGFSFLADGRPATRQLVAALGRTPFKFFVAEVVNQRLVEHDCQAKILVGCRFVSRVK